MLSRPLFVLGFFALIVLTSQSHVIHKRGMLSRLFGGGSKSSNQDVEGNLPAGERSKYRELLKNPIVITMLTAAVGMIVQQALQTRNMNDVCDNKYVRMAHTASGFSPDLQRLVNLLGCNGPNRKYGSSTMPSNKFSTTPGYSDDDNEEQQPDANDQDTNTDEGEALESGFTPEKESRFRQIASIARGEKGAKRNFLKGLFGLNKKDKTFKPGQKLPSSSYKLDKDDANALKDLDKELEQYNKALH